MKSVAEVLPAGTSYLTGSNAIEPSGARAFKINGVPIVIRGDGFDPNLFLRYSAADTTKQIALMKNMGLNSIRLEGHLMPDDFFEQMDAAGILINAGFQCCDAWQVNGALTSAQLGVVQNSAQTVGENLRNHPSVFSFQWSDNQPSGQQESGSIAGFTKADFYPQTPLIASAEYKATDTLGASGEKEGPYDWVPPDYWHDTTNLGTDPAILDAGAASGFDSEQSAGDTIPTMDSLRRFMSASDLATHVTITNTSKRRSLSCCAPTFAGAPRAVGCRQATVNCSHRSGRAMTSPCSPARRRR